MSIPGLDISFMLRVSVLCTILIAIAYSQFHILITELHLKFKNLVESFIFKLEQGLELEISLGDIIRFDQKFTFLLEAWKLINVL